MSRRSRGKNQQDRGEASAGTGKQWAAGGLAVAFGYAALFTTGLGFFPDPVQTFITDASWQQAPLHALFTMATGSVGAGAAALLDKAFSGGGSRRGRAPRP